MLSIFPKFYKNFLCKADKCKHSCCKGWEIDIDEETAGKYLAMTGELGAEIRQNIGKNEDSYFFKLTEDERCPFLQKNGLCKIILNIGEENICEICTMHPRFFTMLDDVELCGVGLSCEKTCELLLGDEKDLVFYIEDTEEELSFSEVLAVIGLNLPNEMQEFSLAVNAENINKVLEIMAKTEPIDENWSKELSIMQDMDNVELKAKEYLENSDKNILNKIYKYILYRQLERLVDIDIEALINYAQYSILFIILHTMISKELGESVRRWSEQIEYDTDNVDLILAGV
ncbi:MAG: flagellin lysine-N-methylase [Selenomonadaceae bacterium]|nr:flagellin lysine-N-methylase [Selenomonadaceae bacterium]